MFYNDVANEIVEYYNLTKDVADRIVYYAWEQHSSSGFINVYYTAIEIAELFKGEKK